MGETYTEGDVTVELAGADTDLIIFREDGTEVRTIRTLCQWLSDWHGEPDGGPSRVQAIYARSGARSNSGWPAPRPIQAWLSVDGARADGRVEVTVSYEPDGKGIVARGWYVP